MHGCAPDIKKTNQQEIQILLALAFCLNYYTWHLNSFDSIKCHISYLPQYCDIVILVAREEVAHREQQWTKKLL